LIHFASGILLGVVTFASVFGQLTRKYAGVYWVPSEDWCWESARCRPAIPKGRHSEKSAIPKAVIQGLRGIVLDIVSYYLDIGRFKEGKGPAPRCQKSPFTFPMLHKQLVMIAYLTLWLSLSHRIRLYPFDVGVFLLFCS